MSLFAVWRFVRIYCPMSCSITLSDFLSEFFLPLLVWFFVLFFVRIREMPYSISLSDFLFDFFARYFVPRLVRFCFRLFCPNLYVLFLAGFSVWFFVPIYCPMSSCSISLCDFLSDYIFRFFVRLLCSICFVRFFCFILCPIFCSFCFSDVSAFDMPMIFHSHASKAHFHQKGWALDLILKVMVFGTRKWPIG